MSKANSHDVGQLIKAEIRRHVQQSDPGTVLIANSIASEILRLHPTCGVERRTLADQIMIAASAAGLPVEIGSEEPRRT